VTKSTNESLHITAPETIRGLRQRYKVFIMP